MQQCLSVPRAHNQSLSAVPVVDTTPEEPPPFVVVVHGPPGVGKTTLIKNLIKHYVNQNLSEVKGPITVVSGKTRRLTFVECPQVGVCVSSLSSVVCSTNGFLSGCCKCGCALGNTVHAAAYAQGMCQSSTL